MRAVSVLFLFCVSLTHGSVCYSHSNTDNAPDPPILEAVHCPGLCWSHQITILKSLNESCELAWTYQGCGSGNIPLKNIMSPESVLIDEIGNEELVDQCMKLGMDRVKNKQFIYCLDDKQLIMESTAPQALAPQIPLALQYIKHLRVCCCLGDLCNGPQPPSLSTTNRCYGSSNVAGSDNKPLKVTCPPGPCMHHKYSMLIDLEDPESEIDWVVQGCGVGEMSLKETQPSNSPTAKMFANSSVTNLCDMIGLGHVEKMTCIDDIEFIASHAPKELQPIVPNAMQYYKKFRICCCNGNLCNEEIENN